MKQVNFELLRVVATMMVVVLHYLGKGNFLAGARGDLGAMEVLAWILEAFCIVAVNLYVLISGYFLTDSTFRPSKFFKLWGQVLFYSLLVPAILIATGILPLSDVNAEQLLTWCFPLLREHYWFATSYLLMYLFSPFLSAGLKQLNQKQHGTAAFLLFCCFSLSKSILPFDIALDKGGYEVSWFLFLFIVASYLRLYGFPSWLKGRKGFFVYLGSCFGIMVLAYTLRFIYGKTGKLEGFIASPYQYNHVLCLLASLGLFGFFTFLTVRRDWIKSVVYAVSPATFGIYLLHENEAVRMIWPYWIGAENIHTSLGLVAGCIMAVIILFIAGIFTEWIRKKGGLIISRIISSAKKGNKLC